MSSRNSEADNPSVLESQFILRLLPEPAKALRHALVNNSNLRDRVSIKIEPDMRQGEVRIDHWLLTAKVLDLPTIVESLKTIDGRGFYKTADICQMLVCKEDEGIVSVEDESPQNQQKSSRKVDKKYLNPHGITPPMKNVRKRRFRKTLKKKYVEAPEIEKEVKRLLREDNESVVPVKWEVINEDESGITKMGHGSKKTLTNINVKREPLELKQERDLEENVAMAGDSSVVDKIFGGAVSDSEDDADYDPDRRMDRDLDQDGDTADAETHIKFENMEMDDNSQNSAEDSHLTDSNSVMNNLNQESKILTEFSSEMFNDSQNSPPSILQNIDFYNSSPSSLHPYSNQNLTRSTIERRLEDLHVDLEQLKMRCSQHEVDIENSDNLNLRQRLQDIRDRCIQDQLQKEQEIIDLQELLKE